MKTGTIPTSWVQLIASACHTSTHRIPRYLISWPWDGLLSVMKMRIKKRGLASWAEVFCTICVMLERFSLSPRTGHSVHLKIPQLCAISVAQSHIQSRIIGVSLRLPS
ncbi:hypothetical protein F5Y06DRAFT_233164 [Hypoxylon sp. FL0890]|nr:hypothetical protein F5Y06DRAFT_233164 [Hypoxylon sp. FL0890]